MITTIEAVIKLVRSELTAIAIRMEARVRQWLSEVFSWDIFAPSRLIPGFPRLFDVNWNFVVDTLDILLDGIRSIPPLIAATIILDRIKPHKKLRQQVMSLDRVVLFTAKVLIEQGIRNAASPMPREWGLFKVVDRWLKISAVLKTPKLEKVWKLIFGGPWTKVIQIVLVSVYWLRQMGLLVCLWNFATLVADETKWNLFFSSALSQDAPRKAMKVRIRRRIGGVKP